MDAFSFGCISLLSRIHCYLLWVKSVCAVCAKMPRAVLGERIVKLRFDNPAVRYLTPSCNSCELKLPNGQIAINPYELVNWLRNQRKQRLVTVVCVHLSIAETTVDSTPLSM